MIKVETVNKNQRFQDTKECIVKYGTITADSEGCIVIYLKLNLTRKHKSVSSKQ